MSECRTKHSDYSHLHKEVLNQFAKICLTTGPWAKSGLERHAKSTVYLETSIQYVQMPINQAIQNTVKNSEILLLQQKAVYVPSLLNITSPLVCRFSYFN